MAKRNATPDGISTNGAADVPAPADDSGVKPAPYDATWINVNAAAKRADVTTQTVRNAYREHSAFNPESGPAWFTTKMVDAFGNATDYDVVYLDSAAVDAWINARAEKGAGTGTPHGGAKRRIVRVTDAQVAAQPTDEHGNPCVALVDGTLIALELPPMGKRKSATPEAAEVPADATPADADATLFDVALTEA